jgi:hypothetical protein
MASRAARVYAEQGRGVLAGDHIDLLTSVLESLEPWERRTLDAVAASSGFAPVTEEERAGVVALLARGLIRPLGLVPEVYGVSGDGRLALSTEAFRKKTARLQQSEKKETR